MSMRKLFAGYSEKLKQIPIMKSLIAFKESNWANAVLLIFGLPVIPLYALLSLANQGVRKLRGYVDIQEYDTDVAATRFTKKFNYHKYLVTQWDLTQVLMKIYWWGIIIFFLTVGVTLILNIVLALLRESIADLHFAVLIVVWFACGLVAFALPPVPGPPVYLLGGVLIVSKAEAFISNPGLAFFVGNLITIVLCTLLKLCACTIQQKLIGQPLGMNLKIRQTVGVHKPMMRCVEMVLREPGVTMGKVSILCGGPDWPTSVLCGILRIPLKEALLGTLPILIFIIPVVCTGSFLLKSDENEFFSPLASLMVAVSFMAVFVMGMAATSKFQDYFNRYNDELTIPRPDFLELDWMTYKQDRKDAACVELLKWSKLGICLKSVLVINAACQIVCSFLWSFASGSCFEDFQITDSPGDITADFIKLPGILGLGLLVFSVFLYVVMKKCLINPMCKKKNEELDAEAETMRSKWEAEREAQRLEIEAKIEHKETRLKQQLDTLTSVIEDKLIRADSKDKSQLRKSKKKLNKLQIQTERRQTIRLSAMGIP